MKILVTGGNGQLGSALRLASAESSHRYIFTDIEELDITSKSAIRAFVAENGIDAVVNCAAYTAVDAAEENEELADMINHKAVAALAEVCKEHNATLIHISTDYIFDGNASTPYKEEDMPAPQSIYGRTKLLGEQAVAASGCRAIILRTAWLYSEFGRNFVKTMRGLMSSRPEIKVVADQVGTPTYAGNLAKAIVEIVESNVWTHITFIYSCTKCSQSCFIFFEPTKGSSHNLACIVIPTASDICLNKLFIMLT